MVRRYFYCQAGKSVPPIFCIPWRVEGKPGLITVGWILLNYILILCEKIFVPELQSHVFCSAVQLALKSNILLYIDLLSFRLLFGHVRLDTYDKCTFLASNFDWTMSLRKLWNACFRLHHKSCSERDTTVYPSLRKASYRLSLVLEHITDKLGG